WEEMMPAGGRLAVLGGQSLAHLEYVLGEFDAAHAQLERIAPLPPGALWPRRTRVQLFDVEQRWVDAAGQLAELRTLSPHADAVWRDAYSRGNYLYRAGHLDEARTAFAEIIELAPEQDY